MKSRSYSGIASSSLLLLSISCMSQSHRSQERVDDPAFLEAEDSGDEKADARKEERKLDLFGPAAADAGEEPPDEGDEGDVAVGAEEGTEGAVPDGCGVDEMPFEGKCTPKEKVTKILDRRENEAISKYQSAKRPEEAAEAAHDLLEQQVAQVEKTEDDLDEILEMLREEDRKKKGGGDKKGDL